MRDDQYWQAMVQFTCTTQFDVFIGSSYGEMQAVGGLCLGLQCNIADPSSNPASDISRAYQNENQRIWASTTLLGILPS
ncbi:hypothetical protein FDECE_1183 [Fusarium decemcellulare]|nr:hypothetical protein FDECE_1183 [Fusarium decemcellulare]